MAIGGSFQLGSLMIELQELYEGSLVEGITVLGSAILTLGLVAAIVVWLCSDPSDGPEARAEQRRKDRDRVGLQAEDVKLGAQYKLKAPAALRLGPGLDSPQAGALQKGEWLTVKTVRTLSAASSGTGAEVTRLCCAHGRGWASLRAKDGTDLFRARARMTRLDAERVLVGGSYRVRSAAAVRTGPEMLSPKAEIEFLAPGDWLTVGEICALSAEESGTGEEVVRLRCVDGRGWVSLCAKGGHHLFDAEASALEEDESATTKVYDDDDEDSASDGSHDADKDPIPEQPADDDDEELSADAIVGATVTLQAMMSAAGSKLNGTVVTVVSYDERTERYGVKFADGSQKAVKLRNLGPPPAETFDSRRQAASAYVAPAGDMFASPMEQSMAELRQSFDPEPQDGPYESDDDDDADDRSNEDEDEIPVYEEEDDDEDDDGALDEDPALYGNGTDGQPRHMLRYRTVAPRAVIRDGVSISSEQVGELVEGDVVDGWEEMLSEGHIRLRISENEWVSRVTAGGRPLLEAEPGQGEAAGETKERPEPTSEGWSLVLGLGVLGGGIAVAPGFVPGIKLGLSARWRKSGLRYPPIPLGSGFAYGYVCAAVGVVVVAVFLRTFALMVGDPIGSRSRATRGVRTGYLAFHSAALLLVAFFTCALAARLHDLPPTPGDSLVYTTPMGDDEDGDGDLGAVGALLGCVIALSRWRQWLAPYNATDVTFPWWLAIIAGLAGGVTGLALHVGNSGYLGGAARITRALPFLFYLPAPVTQGRGRGQHGHY